MQEASIYAGIQGEGIVGQEDCLYLDIKAPVNNLNRRLPVMFWIHGGGYAIGAGIVHTAEARTCREGGFQARPESAFDSLLVQNYDGARIAALADTIVVTIECTCASMFVFAPSSSF